MVWGGVSMRGKTQLVLIDGNLSAQRYHDEILDPVGLPYLQTLGQGAILQITKEWDAIPQIRITRLVSSMRIRYQATIFAFGGSLHAVT